MSVSGLGAVFLDRDGVINEEVHYLNNPDQLVMIPGAAAAICQLNRLGIPVAVVTNQSGIARGYFSKEVVDDIHEKLDQLLVRQGARIDRYYVCPHHPKGRESAYRKRCDCRKPGSRLLELAVREMNIDLYRSVMIGDQISDLRAGQRAGCRVVLVLTGHGRRSESRLREAAITPDWIATDLPDAVSWFIDHHVSTFQTKNN